MPYVTCPICALRTYCVREDECPRCGTLLVSSAALRRRASARLSPHQSEGVLRALDHAVRELEVSVAFVSEIADEGETILWSVGDDSMPAFVPDAALPLEETVCRHMLSGRIGNLVADTRAEPILAGLPVVQATGMGAYVGVPLSAAGARLYVLCCLAREARHDLSDADVRFLRLLAESLRPTLDRRPGKGGAPAAGIEPGDR
jgi:GAF domain-containing protein